MTPEQAIDRVLSTWHAAHPVLRKSGNAFADLRARLLTEFARQGAVVEAARGVIAAADTYRSLYGAVCQMRGALAALDAGATAAQEPTS